MTPQHPSRFSGQGLLNAAVKAERELFLAVVARSQPAVLADLADQSLRVFADHASALRAAAVAIIKAAEDREAAARQPSTSYFGVGGSIVAMGDGLPVVRKPPPVRYPIRLSSDAALELLLERGPAPHFPAWAAFAPVRKRLKGWGRRHYLEDQWCIEAAAKTLWYWHFVERKPGTRWFNPYFNRIDVLTAAERVVEFRFPEGSTPLQLAWEIGDGESSSAFRKRAMRAFTAAREVHRREGRSTHGSRGAFEEVLRCYIDSLSVHAERDGLRPATVGRAARLDYDHLSNHRAHNWLAQVQCGGLSVAEVARRASADVTQSVGRRAVSTAIARLAARIGLTPRPRAPGPPQESGT